MNKFIYYTILIGWKRSSCGYHSNNGRFYRHSESGKSYGPLFTTGDTIGCYLNFKNDTIFYTKNGVHLGNKFDTNIGF